MTGTGASFAGHLLDGRTAEAHPATVVVAARALEVGVPGGDTRRWLFTALRQTQGFRAPDPVRFEHRDGASRGTVETLIVRDRAILDAMAARGWRRARRRARGALAVAGGVVALLGAVAAVLWGIPAGSAALARLVPDAVGDRLGRSILASFPPGSVCHDPEREGVIRGLVERLAGAGGIAPPAIVVVDFPVPNAFALPGGRIIVLRGLLDLADSPEMLAGVLAHEIAHLVHRHPMQGVLRQATLSFVVSALTGGAISARAAATLTALNYSREMEEQADHEAVAILTAARVDPLGLARFLERTSVTPEGERDGRSVFRYLSTHPDTSSRTELVRALASRAGPPPEKLLPGYAWDEMRELCLPR